jgi:uncharacterized radical SAM superfamily Fe-S cluster-containing enzyme
MSADYSQRTEHMGIWYCPVCGEEVEPIHSWHSEDSAEATVECPEHGEIMVEYYEPE